MERFVTYYGVLELPALVIACAPELSLGARSWCTVRGRNSVSHLADAIERTFWVLVSLGVMPDIAALLEGFVRPYNYRFLLEIVQVLEQQPDRNVELEHTEKTNDAVEHCGIGTPRHLLTGTFFNP